MPAHSVIGYRETDAPVLRTAPSGVQHPILARTGPPRGSPSPTSSNAPSSPSSSTGLDRSFTQAIPSPDRASPAAAAVLCPCRGSTCRAARLLASRRGRRGPAHPNSRAAPGRVRGAALSTIAVRPRWRQRDSWGIPRLVPVVEPAVLNQGRPVRRDVAALPGCRIRETAHGLASPNSCRRPRLRAPCARYGRQNRSEI